MIASEAGLAKTRKSLAMIEAAYDDLRRDVKPKNEHLFNCMAESYIDLLLELRAEIDAYIGIHPRPVANGAAPSPDASPVPVHAG